jgi:hypothetical protein
MTAVKLDGHPQRWLASRIEKFYALKRCDCPLLAPHSENNRILWSNGLISDSKSGSTAKNIAANAPTTRARTNSFAIDGGLIKMLPKASF